MARRRKESPPTNPFVFGALALDAAFTDREQELAELASDIRNGQDVVVYAPRRIGKSSLVLRAAQRALADDVLVAYCDVMLAATKEQLAAQLAQTIYDDIASPLERVRDRALDLFRSLRIQPRIELDVNGNVIFGFDAARRQADVDATITALLELPAHLAADRKRTVALVFDEFQEIMGLDAHYPNLMRGVFQHQPEVAHVYLGSKRHMMRRIFEDRNEPFWRSVKSMELGLIDPSLFSEYVSARFSATGKSIRDDAVAVLVETTQGHPYATQQLAYFTWEKTLPAEEAQVPHVESALEAVLRAEHRHFSRLWDDATRPERLLLLSLAQEPGRPYSQAYRERHLLPNDSLLQRALGALQQEDVVGRAPGGDVTIVEPFLAQWVLREQRDYLDTTRDRLT